MVAVAVFSFEDMGLKLLFAFLLFSSYVSLCVLSILLYYLRHNTAAKMRGKVKCFFYILHGLYAVCLVIGLTSDLGASCSSDRLIPLVLYFAEGLGALVFLLMLVLSSQSYFIDWGDAGQEQIKRNEYRLGRMRSREELNDTHYPAKGA